MAQSLMWSKYCEQKFCYVVKSTDIIFFAMTRRNWNDLWHRFTQILEETKGRSFFMHDFDELFSSKSVHITEGQDYISIVVVSQLLEYNFAKSCFVNCIVLDDDIYIYIYRNFGVNVTKLVRWGFVYIISKPIVLLFNQFGHKSYSS